MKRRPISLRSLRIAIDASQVSPSRPRGYFRLVSLILRALSENKEAHHYVVLASDPSMRRLIPSDPRFHWAPPRRYIPLLHRSGTGWLGKWLLRGLDLVHFPSHEIWYSYRGKSIVNIHDLAPLHFPERFFKNPSEEVQYQTLLKKIVEHATLILTGSHFSRDDILRCLHVDPERVKVIHPSNDWAFLNHAEPLTIEEMKHWGFAPPYFLFTGQMSFRKNIPLLLKAYSRYCERGGENHLVLVGGQDPKNPTRFPPLEPLLDQMKERSRVFWLRRVPDEVLARIYAGARALVNLSFFEGFGSPLIEAMACGTPVVASRLSSFPEVAGDAALLVEAEEEEVTQALLDLDQDEALRRRLIDRGKRRSLDFLPAKMAEELLQVYKKVANNV